MQPSAPHTNWPQAADPAAAARLIEAFGALGPAEAGFAQSATGQSLLTALGGNAAYLADLALHEPGWVLRTAEAGPDPAIAEVLAGLRNIAPQTPRAALARALRIAKRQAALIIALADLSGAWTLPQITLALSELAEASLRVAIAHLLATLHEQQLIQLPNPAQPALHSGFVALALGKLGASELNYSSDIDLVLLFDPQSPAYPDAAQPIMARLARDLVNLLSKRDEHGYVFRVDLRLRPDPSATPPVVSLQAALAYYEAHGRTWERAAFSKARPIAGDLALGTYFLAAIRPFIWRRHLDFAAIADINDMKRRIDAGPSSRNGAPSLLGYDVKLGKGGIREIEFIVQTLSLVWGGQDPQLRIPQTLKALPALAAAGHLPAAAANELAADYHELRRVEHRLQMIGDRQTHALPTTPAGLTAFIVFIGEPDFAETFSRLLQRVRGHFLKFFEVGNASQSGMDPGAAGDPPAEFTARLQALGFTDIKHIAERLRDWSSGHMAALRSDRARDLLVAILPGLLAALGRQPEPDRAFGRFDTLLSKQQAGIQLLSLFQHNNALLDRLAAVLGAAPALAEHLTHDAQALEALLVPSARFAAPKPLLQQILKDARDLEDALALTRRFVRREEFHLSVAMLEGKLDTDEAGHLRTNLAQAALAVLLPRIIGEHQNRYGQVSGAAFAVVALGKAGSGEMLPGSDLDLMLIYDHAPMETPPISYFVRLAHLLTGTLTAQGPEGPLYKIDMRLRPSGNAGPVAVSLAAFRRYHAAESWTWERLALTRARVMAATPGFTKIVTEEIITALSRCAPPAQIREDTAKMNQRLAVELPPAGPFDVKHRVGGMMELAFIAEAMQLIHGPKAPALFEPNIAASLKSLAAAGHLPQPDAASLIAADHLWRTVQGIDRITGLADRESEPGPSRLIPLLRATGLPDLAALTLAMDQAGANVRDCFTRHIISQEVP